MATRRPTNIKTGGKSIVELIGLKELEAKLSDLIDVTIAPEAASIVRGAAEITWRRAVANAKAANVPHEATEDIFLYGGKQRGNREREGVTALVGLRKRGRNRDAKGYVEWTPKSQVGKFEKTQRSKARGQSLVVPGTKSAKGTGGIQKIGENLGTMWELGTTKQSAKPWFRPAVSETRAEVLVTIASGYKSLIEKKAKQK